MGEEVLLFEVVREEMHLHQPWEAEMAQSYCQEEVRTFLHFQAQIVLLAVLAQEEGHRALVVIAWVEG